MTMTISRIVVVRIGRLELPTPDLKGLCYYQLSYIPITVMYVHVPTAYIQVCVWEYINGVM